MKCGKGHEHASVAEIRACYGVSESNVQTLNYKKNMYPGNCQLCGGKVDAEQGRVDKIDGKWQTSHLDGKCPAKPKLEAPRTIANTDRYDGIPTGHYATVSLTGKNDLDFWRVDRPEQGAYAGRTFVKRIVGGKPDLNVSRDTKFKALEAILEFGPEKSAQLYGMELGRCSRCNRHLTDETSRLYGMGPECRGKR
jgi:hypothetical protein